MNAQENANKNQCPKIQVECPCPKTDCENHGACCRCVNRHRGLGNLVNCMREGVLTKPREV